MRTGLIYKIENNLNNKKYIGQTVTSLSERWNGHKYDSKRRNTPLYASMKKHLDNIDGVFTVSIIEDDVPYGDLDEREIHWIGKFNSLHPNGYNLSCGGQAFRTEQERELMRIRVLGEKNPMYNHCGELNPFYGKTHSEETKKKISELAKGRTVSDETKDKIGIATSIRHKTLGHPMQGKNHSIHAKEKISMAMKNRIISDDTRQKMSQNHPRKQSVIMIDKNTDIEIMTFDSMKLASEWIKENTNYQKAKSSEISSVCNGRKKSAYGFKWVYLKGVETIL